MSNVIELTSMESALGTAFDSTKSFEENRAGYEATYNALTAPQRIDFMQNLVGGTFATGVLADKAFAELEEKPAVTPDPNAHSTIANADAFSVTYGVGTDSTVIEYVPVMQDNANFPVDAPTQVIISSCRKTLYTTGGVNGNGVFQPQMIDGVPTEDSLDGETNKVVKMSGQTSDDLEVDLTTNIRFMNTVQGKALFGGTYNAVGAVGNPVSNMPSAMVDETNGAFNNFDFKCTMITRTIDPNKGHTYLNTSKVVVDAFKASPVFNAKCLGKNPQGVEGVICFYRKEARCKFISWGNKLDGLLGDLFESKLRGAAEMALDTKRKTVQKKEVEAFDLNYNKENSALVLEIENAQNATYLRLCKTLPEPVAYRRAFEA